MAKVHRLDDPAKAQLKGQLKADLSPVQEYDNHDVDDENCCIAMLTYSSR